MERRGKESARDGVHERGREALVTLVTGGSSALGDTTAV